MLDPPANLQERVAVVDLAAWGVALVLLLAWVRW